MCGQRDCYREIPCYWRCAIELFPVFRKERVPIARFECPRMRSTISFLPVQLIPYHQYTVHAVIGALLLGLRCRVAAGGGGCYGASVEMDPDSEVTPWLILCWLRVVAKGLERAHAVLMRAYDLSHVRSSVRCTGPAWDPVFLYFRGLAITANAGWPERILSVAGFYSRATGGFLFGVASQQRHLGCV